MAAREGIEAASATVARSRPELLVFLGLVCAFLYVFDKANDRLGTQLGKVAAAVERLTMTVDGMAPCPCLEGQDGP